MSKRYRELLDIEYLQKLSPLDEAELANLKKAFIDEEARRLAAATDRLRSERRRIEAQNRALSDIAERKEALSARLATAVRGFAAERKALDRK